MAHRIQWSEIRTLTDSMAELAELEHWEKLVEVESRRNILLHAYFEQQPPLEVSEQEIVEVMELDRKIMELCLFRRKSIGEKIKRFINSRRAKNAYIGNS